MVADADGAFGVGQCCSVDLEKINQFNLKILLLIMHIIGNKKSLIINNYVIAFFPI